jgi:outer membrane protein TolC
MSIFSLVRARRAPFLPPYLKAAWITAVALTAVVASSHAQTALSLGDAQRIAVERSRQLVAQDASIQAMKEMGAAAGQLPDPVLKLGIDNVPADGPDRFSLTRDFMTMRRIGVMQEITRGDKRKLKTERFEREADRAAAEKSVAIAVLHKDTALAWLDRYYLERMHAVVAAQAQEASLEIEAAESAYRAGRGRQIDIYSARASRVALDDRLSELDRRLRSARTMLARWVGDAAEMALAGQPDLTKGAACVPYARAGRRGSPRNRAARAPGGGRSDRGPARARQQAGRLERRARVPGARLGFFEHVFRRRLRAAAMGPEESPGPRARS